MHPCASLALCFAVFLPAAAGAQDPADPLRRPEAGFEIAPPGADWTVQEAGSLAGNDFQLALTPPAGARVQVLVRVGANAAPEEPAGYRDALLATLVGQPQHSGIEKISRSVAGREAPGLALDTETAGETYRLHQWVLVEHGLRYILQCHAPAADFEQYRKAFERAFDSFAFVELAGEAAGDPLLRELAARCGSEWDWAPDWETAARRARSEGRLVMVYARFYPGFALTDDVISGPLMDQDIVALVRERFVPLRLTPEMSAPFRSPEVYGLSGTTFGQAVLVADTGGRILAQDSLLRVSTIDAALRRGLAAAGQEIVDETPAGESAGAALRRALRQRRLQNGERALEELEAAERAADPADAALRDRVAVVRGTVQLGLGRAEAAEASFSELLDQRPDSAQAPEARFLLGACLYQRQDGAGAERVWRALAEDHPDSRWAWQAAAALRSTLFEYGLGADLSWPGRDRIAAVGWRPSETLPVAEVVRAERDALAWLLAAQQPDGSWIGPSDLGRVIDRAEDAHTIAFTALAGKALLPHRAETAAVGEAVDRALAFLLAARIREKEREPRIFFMDYTPWSKAASIRFLMSCLDAGAGKAEALRGMAAELVTELGDKQKPGGGWSYYLSRSLKGAARPAPQSISFTTAAVMLALLRAEGAGIEVPAAVRRAGLECLVGMRNPNGTFEYMTSPGQGPRAQGNGRPGAAGRGPVCSMALVRGGREERDELRARLDIYLEHLEELRRERGKSLIHAGRQGQGSHYLMFDYATAAEAVALLPEEQRARFRGPLLESILQARNADGSFSDSPLTGPAAGTALALIAFERLRPLP